LVGRYFLKGPTAADFCGTEDRRKSGGEEN